MNALSIIRKLSKLTNLDVIAIIPGSYVTSEFIIVEYISRKSRKVGYILLLLYFLVVPNFHR